MMTIEKKTHNNEDINIMKRIKLLESDLEQ